MIKITQASILAVLAFALTSCSEDIKDSLNSEFVSIPDEQFESKLIALGIDSDGRINQQLLKSDAEGVASLDISSENSSDEINSINGIEAFINLKKLIATGNRISEVDLSKNIELDTLNLSGNDITSIDVSKNINLIMLDLKVNDLTAIDGLEQVTKLKWLNLSFNYLTAFTTANASIEHVLASHNELANFNANSLPNLKTLYLLTNHLSALDLSGNASLESLNVGDNRLTTLELGNNQVLNYLSCFSNELTSLDVSKYPRLSYLSANRNPELNCIKIDSDQNIGNIKLSDYQELNVNCE
ncbi:hypothetical protein M3P19_05030 [Muricauda sp. 2012CJ35-5]|uniref:Leucine-rich repeat domain-containing protein n=1 Tax=Flagellimonas spongiicola TaxID=2942208 RepID=A0ABT0PQ03_9FLAO|nr:hypothetical protein [Allomuricauda spongiicola]MCL6273361.1 hypothetical protein [Allomuricauda spongiicola]